MITLAYKRDGVNEELEDRVDFDLGRLVMAEMTFSRA